MTRAAVAGAAAVVLVALLVVWACVGKGRMVHPSDTIEMPRKVIIQARGKYRALYLRVRELERTACARKQLTPAQCAESDALDRQWQSDQRELDALLSTPDYEVDWAKFLRTLDSVGAILDKLPLP